MFALHAAKYATGLAISVVLIVAAGACCDEETQQSCLTNTSTSTTSSGGGEGGSSSGTGGSTSTSGTAGGGGIASADKACAGDYAFRAAGMSFTEPTSEALAAAFNEGAFPGEEHPITVVLRASDPGQAIIGASPTDYDQETYMESFAEGLEPTFSPPDAVITQGSFGTASAQPLGYLRIRHLQGMLELQLTNMAINASTGSNCNIAFVTLDAIIPAAEKSKTIVTSAGSSTVGDLGGGAPSNDLQLRGIFLAEAIEFDFSTL